MLDVLSGTPRLPVSQSNLFNKHPIQSIFPCLSTKWCLWKSHQQLIIFIQLVMYIQRGLARRKLEAAFVASVNQLVIYSVVPQCFHVPSPESIFKLK